MTAKIALVIAPLALVVSCVSMFLAIKLPGPAIVFDPNAPPQAPLTAPQDSSSQQFETCFNILRSTSTDSPQASTQLQLAPESVQDAWEKAGCSEYFGSGGLGSPD